MAHTFINEGFVFDDIDSSDYDMIIVRPDTSGIPIQAPFGTKREIIEDSVIFHPMPYFYGVNEQPLTFSITITKKDKDKGLWDRQTRQQIVNWLFQTQYKPFISYDNMDIAYYVIAQGDSQRFDTSLQQGYATIEFRCNAPWGYNYPKNVIDFTQEVYGFNNTTPTIITINNESNVMNQLYYYPELTFELLDGTNGISINNLTIGNELFQFTGLTSGELVYVDNDSHRIESSLPNTYRRSNFNKGWLRLVQGVNRLAITGKANLEFKLQYPMAL